MTSASRPTRDTDNRQPRLLQLAERLAESETGELRRGADSGPARRTVAFDEPTVTDVKPDAVTTDVVRFVDLPAIDPELRAAQSELRRLRGEVAELMEEVRRLARDTDATVVSTRPTAPVPQAAPAPPKPSPTPRQAPAQRAGQTPAARRPKPTPYPRTPAAAPAPAPAAWRTLPGQAVTERIVPRTAPGALSAPTPYRPAPPKPSIGLDRPQPAGWRPSPTPAVAPAPAAAPAAAPSGLEAGYSAVLAEVLGVAQVPATSNFFDDLGADSLLMARFCARVRSRPDLPNVGIKDIYQAPSIAALAAAGAGAATSSPAAAPSGLEAGYSAVLAEVLGVAQVPATSNFFDDLGADSLLMARFCARVRALPELPNVGIKDIYAAPSIAALAAAGAATSSRSGGVALAAPARQPAQASGQDAPTVVIPGGKQDPRTAPVGTLRYLLCGLLQMLFLLGYPALIAYGFAVGEEWVIGAATPLDVYLQSLGVAGALFLGTSLLPILAKWLLVGRWKQGQFPVWGLRYFRFWLVKTLIRTSPLVRFVGTPLYPFYLRLLGAKIGKGVTILSPTVPVCTDLLTIGAGTIIRKASSFSCYRAHDGQIQVGPVTIGADVLVGEATVLDIGSSLGDRSQLGHTSSLHAGMSVPAGERWHGSPAEPTSVNYRAVPTDGRTALRKLLYSLTQLVVLFGVVLPLGLSGLTLLVREVPQVQALFVDVETAAVHVPFVLDVVILSSVLFFGGLLFALLAMTTVPRLLAPLVRPNKTYSLYGIAYWALRTITRTTNSKFFTRVFGDSSYIVGYLRALGYRFGRVEQTGSNFGTAVVHDTPFLCEIGSGTVGSSRVDLQACKLEYSIVSPK